MDGNLLSIKGIVFLVFSVFAVTAVGYILGRITIKGVNLGTAGVFIVALLYGVFFFNKLSTQLVLDGTEASFVKEALKVVENIGLVLFVTSVGFIAGPNFFKNLKANYKSYVLLGFIIIVVASLTAVGCIFFDLGVLKTMDKESIKAMVVGLMSGSLTSTPAFSATKEAVATAELQDVATVGHGIAYLFGVVGVVLFVQLVPKFCKADMAEERAKITIESEKKAEAKDGKKFIDVDEFGFMALGLAIGLGILIGNFGWKSYKLTTTGGCLVVALILGHFGKVGRISIMPKASTLKVMRELGLMLFLIGAGIPGGAKFVELFKPVYFIYGVVMTLVPMIVGYFFAKYVLKMPLLNNLGSITGGMTSTPALGTLINVAGTEEVASAYASTYPIALIAIVIASQLIIKII